jgi:cell wall-associated NlpC family hydrolase
MPADIQTPVGRAPIIPVVMIGAGFYLAWFAIHYWGSDTKYPTDPVKAVLQGKPLPAASGQASAASIASTVETQAQATASGSSAPGGSPTQTGNAIADTALRYSGAGYVYGGPADRPGNWDCSSFVSYVLGLDLGMALPGGGHYGDSGYPPHAHGPTTLNYLLYGTPVNLGEALPGDLVVSTEHMGIVIGSGHMISAQDPQLGTGVAGYLSGFPAGPPSVRRVSVQPNSPSQGQAGAGGGHP